MAADAETEGDGYFASVSDLMVGVLFVFLLMLTVFALNFRDAEDGARVTIEELRAALEEVEKQKSIAEEQQKLALRKEAENLQLRKLLEGAIAQLERDIERRQFLRGAMLESLETSLQQKGVRVSIDKQSGILRLSGDLLFQTGQEVYRPEAAVTVRTLAQVLGEVLPCFANQVSTSACPEATPILETVLVEGHTDRQPYRGVSLSESQARNDELSTRRALVVFQTLRQTEPDLEALRNADGMPLLGVSGYGQRRPLADAVGDTQQDYERNRRIDLRFVLTSRTSDELETLRRQIRSVLEDTQ